MTTPNAPILILHASRVPYLSIARIAGGVRYNGNEYYYDPGKDILILEGWVKFYNKMPYDQFVEAAKTGVKPTLPKKEKKTAPVMKTLFD